MSYELLRGSCLVLCAWLTGCFSPVQDDLIESLGPEQEGVPEGPTHRYGQPCLACHDAYYGEGPELSIGGTVFATPDADIPVQGAIVTISDATGKQVKLTSNCAGNFYAERRDFDPVFPLRAEVECPLPDGTTRRAVMGTRINRDGSCASCHQKGAATPQSPGQVYCVPQMPATPFVVPVCNGGPNPQ